MTGKEVVVRRPFVAPVHDLKALLGVDRLPEGDLRQKACPLTPPLT